MQAPPSSRHHHAFRRGQPQAMLVTTDPQHCGGRKPPEGRPHDSGHV